MRRLGRLFFSSVLSLVVVSGLSRPASAESDQDQKAGAQKTFEAGSKLYDGQRTAEALVAFRASYQILASPNSRLMIARCLRDLGRNIEAYLEYEAVLREATEKGDRYESAARASTEEGADVKQKIALLTVRVATPPEGLTVKIGDEPLAASSLGVAVPLDPGPRVVTAQASDGSSARVEIVLEAGTAKDVQLELVAPAPDAPPPPPPPPPAVVHVEPKPSGAPLRTWAYVAGGVGVVGLGAFGIFGSMSSSKFSDLESACPDRRCGPGNQDDIDSGKTYQTVANVGLGVGVVGLGAGVVLFLMSSSDSKEEKSASALSVQIGTRSVAVGGAF